jgi:hypothetical protein
VRILGIDPGLATGVAIYNTDTCSFEFMEQIDNGVRGFSQEFLGISEQANVDVCENFTLRSSNKFTADLSGVEIIGWLKGERYWGGYNPEPSQHMQLTRLRKNKDDYTKSPVTKLMKSCGFKIGKGHTRMAGSVAIWYAAKVLYHEPTLELLKPKDS